MCGTSTRCPGANRVEAPQYGSGADRSTCEKPRVDGPASQRTKALFADSYCAANMYRSPKSPTLDDRSGNEIGTSLGCRMSRCSSRQTLPIAASRSRIRALDLNPVANIVDSPSTHADEQLDWGGDITRQHVAPQRRLRNGNQGKHLRQAHKAGMRNDRCGNADGVARGK
jgi:hypothetical protein